MQYLKEKFIIFLTGASGVGKTTLVSSLEEKYKDDTKWAFLHFDSIGVPSPEEMVNQYGSGEEWQRKVTHQWVEKMVNSYQDKVVVVMEGQVDIKFIKEAFREQSFTNYTIILVDCSTEKMRSRLTHQRQQPELVGEKMNNWLLYLREQAEQKGISIINTTNLSKKEMLRAFEDTTSITFT